MPLSNGIILAIDPVELSILPLKEIFEEIVVFEGFAEISRSRYSGQVSSNRNEPF
jgi:hypothetical protein